MGRKHATAFDRARDELMSHVIRCEVLEAEMDQRVEWLGDTMDYLSDRHPVLSGLELKKLEMVGRQFIKPAIPHGRGHTAQTRDENLEELVEAELGEAIEEEAEELEAAPELQPA